MRIAAIFLSVLSLSGCVSNQKIAAQRAIEDDATCVSYGLKFGTPEYAQCRQNIASQRASIEASYNLARMQVAQQNNAIQQDIAQRQIEGMSRQNRSMQCISNANGGYIYSSCQ